MGAVEAFGFHTAGILNSNSKLRCSSQKEKAAAEERGKNESVGEITNKDPVRPVEEATGKGKEEERKEK